MSKKFALMRIVVSLVGTIALFLVEIFARQNLIGSTNVKLAIILPLSLILYIFISYDLFLKSFGQIKRKDFFNEVALTLIASLAAFAIGEFVEAVAVTVFFQVGEKFEDYAVNKSRESIKSIINLRPDKATLYKNGVETIVEPFDVNVGDLIIVKNGERVPIDGVVNKGESFLDTSSMTGESVPRKVKEGDEIISGVINSGSPLLIKTTKEFSDSTMSKMLDLVENASSNKAPAEKFITTFSKYYTPIVIALAFLVALIPPLFIGVNDATVWARFVQSGASFLVISCPCALVLSVPMAYFVSLGKASKYKVLIKGSNYLDKFRKIDKVVFDKTGTITKGNFVVSDINPEKNYSKDELLNLVQYGEYYSKHPIASAILANKEGMNSELLEDYKEIDGKGVVVKYKQKSLLVGNDKLMDEFNISYTKLNTPFTTIYCAYNNDFIGTISISDEVKETSKNAIKELYRNGVKDTYMLTGDNKEIAKVVAKEANINNVISNLLPLEKVNYLKKIKEENKNSIVAYCGDGVNDAPSLSLADIGISMGLSGSDLAIETSDAVIMDDDLNKLNEAIKISKKNHVVALENIIFALGVKIGVMILSVSNISVINSYIMWLAIFADVGVTIICVLNSLRLMMKNKKK